MLRLHYFTLQNVNKQGGGGISDYKTTLNNSTLSYVGLGFGVDIESVLD